MVYPFIQTCLQKHASYYSTVIIYGNMTCHNDCYKAIETYAYVGYQHTKVIDLE